MLSFKHQIVLALIITLSGVSEVANAGIIGLYQFNDATNIGRDTSGRGNHATSFGAGYTTSGYQYGATSLSGSSYLRVTIDVNPGVLPEMTWGAWVMPNQTNGIRAVISADDGNFDRTINIDPRGGSTWSVFRGTGVFGSGVGPSTTKWTFLAAVYDQATASVTFHVDGQSFSTSSNFGKSWTFFDIGHNPSFGEFFVGSIDNVFVYDRALSSGEIAEIREYGFSAAVPEPSTMIMFVMGILSSIHSFFRRKRLTFSSTVRQLP